ncbi:hypothetical protein LOZ53_003536 [Ophidiomyces ophidiicola]|nr:hypothetical protein LOZ55_005023 [Ophidiomyces ophidiicola]KAI1989089.1 hypothetical protein LOZ54_002997 [Ophidiomyces ophidiicola]KAI1989585.1 hypothetical protein LOZ53_003536 [Ophidiomyces ophidiicola]KAI2003517.1 hypothetical protein LOZ51_000597 [Ophidiomyces ophidiicola]
MSKPSQVADSSERTSVPDGLFHARPEARSVTPITGDSTPLHGPSRSIAVDAILNPPANPSFGSPSHTGQGSTLESPTLSTSPSPSPSPGVALSQTDPARFRLDKSASPRNQQQRAFTPRSPALNAGGVGSRYTPLPGTMDVAHFPFLRSPPPQSSSILQPNSFNYHPPNLVSDPRVPQTQSQPLSQETSPSTPHSSYSPFPQGSPAHLLHQPLAIPQAGLPSFVPHQMPVDATQGLIPVTIDMDSGSRKAAVKRQKNSCASKRFRERKKATEDEQRRIIERFQEEIKQLKQIAVFYRNERDYYRDYVARIPGAHIPQRPVSPKFREHAPLQQVSDSESDDRRISGRNVRPRTESSSSRKSLPATLQPVVYNSPGYPLGPQSPWATVAQGAMPSELPQQFQAPLHPTYQPPPSQPPPRG